MNARIKLTIYDDETIDKIVGVKELRKAIEGLSETGWASIAVRREVGNVTYRTLYIYGRRLEGVHNIIDYGDDRRLFFPPVHFENIPEVKPVLKAQPKGQPKRFAWDSERRCIVGVY